MRLILILSFISLSLYSKTGSTNRVPQQVGGDIGMKFISVNSFLTKQTNSNTFISFTGEDAKNLFNALPKIESSSSHEDSTGFVATGENKAVYIKCSKVNKDIPICTIKMGTPLSIKQLKNKWIN
jgi:hypothetical protein